MSAAPHPSGMRADAPAQVRAGFVARLSLGKFCIALFIVCAFVFAVLNHELKQVRPEAGRACPSSVLNLALMEFDDCAHEVELTAKASIAVRKAWRIPPFDRMTALHWPRWLYWFDNLFVELYGGLFILVGVWAYRRVAVASRGHRVLLGASVVLALLAALCDHSENFWYLAQLGDYKTGPERVLGDIEQQAPAVAMLAVWKFRFVAASALVAVLWLAFALRGWLADRRRAADL